MHRRKKCTAGASVQPGSIDPDRDLMKKDLEDLPKDDDKAWVWADVGEDGKKKGGERGWDVGDYKANYLSDVTLWIVPASLLMTVSLSMIFLIGRDEIDSMPDGFPYERPIRQVAGRAYMLAMVYSSILSLRCVSQYTFRAIALTNQPNTVVPRFLRVRKGVIDAVGRVSTDPPFWVEEMEDGLETWRTTIEELRGCGYWSYRLMQHLKIPDRSEAFVASTKWLFIGLTIGAYLKYGPIDSVLFAFIFWVAYAEIAFRQQMETDIPWKFMRLILKPDRQTEGTEVEAPRSPRVDDPLVR